MGQPVVPMASVEDAALCGGWLVQLLDFAEGVRKSPTGRVQLSLNDYEIERIRRIGHALKSAKEQSK